MLNPFHIPVTLRAVGTPPDHLDVVSLALDLEGRSDAASSLRYRLSAGNAEAIALALLDAVAVQRYRASVQALRSSGMPCVDGSPAEGQSQ